MVRYTKRLLPSWSRIRQVAMVVLLVLGFTPSLFAQLSKLDSLKQVLNQPNLQPGDRVFTLGRLAAHYYFDDQPLAGDRILQEALALATEIPDKQYLARTLAIQAMQLRLKGDAADAERAITRALTAANASDSAPVKAYVYYAKGWLEARNGQEDKAVESFMSALKHYEDSFALSPSDKAIKSSIYGELYGIYAIWEDGPQMEKYARAGLEDARESGNKDALCSALYAFGYSFEQRYRNAPSQPELLDSAAHYYKASISAFFKYDQQISSRNQLPFNAIGLANLYAEFFPISYKDSAQIYLDIALEEGLRTKQYSAVASAYGIISEYAQTEGRWDDAEEHLLRAASYVQKEEMPNIETLARIKRSLSEIYEKKGDDRAALKYYKEFLELYETRFDNQKMTTGKELEVKYQSELKEQQLQRLEEQVAHRKKLSIIYIAFSIATILALCFLWVAYRQRSKAYAQQQRLHEIELERIQQEHKISLLSAMIDGQENERARIARDLHDGLGGLLSGLKIMLSSPSSTNRETLPRCVTSELIQRIDQAVDELRRIARNMMPEILLKFGLTEALKEYSQSLKRSGINITFQSFNFQKELTQNKQVVVYRIAQELVNNAIKYAHAAHILVELRQQGDELSLLVEDDGRGFDMERMENSRGTGLSNIEARSVFLGGQVQIDSATDVGTTVTVTCPI